MVVGGDGIGFPVLPYARERYARWTRPERTEPHMAHQPIDAGPIAGALGAGIAGVDLGSANDDFAAHRQLECLDRIGDCPVA